MGERREGDGGPTEGLPVAWQLGLWGLFGVAFPLWSFRYSKALWLSLDHLVDPVDTGPGERGR